MAIGSKVILGLVLGAVLPMSAQATPDGVLTAAERSAVIRTLTDKVKAKMSFPTGPSVSPPRC